LRDGHWFSPPSGAWLPGELDIEGPPFSVYRIENQLCGITERDQIVYNLKIELIPVSRTLELLEDSGRTVPQVLRHFQGGIERYFLICLIYYHSQNSSAADVIYRSTDGAHRMEKRDTDTFMRHRIIIVRITENHDRDAL
jgi:uncharacterized protein (UPF0262 family)